MSYVGAPKKCGKQDEDDEDTTWSLDYRLDFNERQNIKRLLQEEID